MSWVGGGQGIFGWRHRGMWKNTRDEFFFLTNKLGETPHLEHVIDLLALVSRAVDPEPKQFWMTGGGAKKFQMVEPKIWVPVQRTYFVGQAKCTKKTMIFSLSWYAIVPEPEPKITRGWFRSPKFEFRLHSPGCKEVVTKGSKISPLIP